MFDLVHLGLLGLAATGLILILRKLYPKPYPGIPYNEASAKRLTGDIPDLVPIIKDTNEFSDALFTVTTQKLGTPIAQLLFPGIRKPLIILEDPREIEDIVVRRNKEFDKAPMALDIFGPMFPRASLAQFTTPELKAQKRLWADVMSTDFLRRVAAPNIHKSTCELLDLWRLKASTTYKDQPFNVHDDFKNAALDAIWVAVVGEEPGTTQYEIKKLQDQLAGTKTAGQTAAPIGSFLKEQVAYISSTIARNSNSPSPKLAQKLETYTPRYRKFRSTVSGEMRRAMRTAVERYQSLEVGSLENDAADTCAMDLVLRRQILQAKKAGVAPSDPTKDEAMLDEMFVMLVGGHDSTANTLAWFVRYMALHPTIQTTLRTTLQTSFPGSGPAALPSAPTILDADIPYLDGACEEGMRLAGTAKASLRQALVDTHILGCPIPKGAEVFMNYHVNRAPVPVEEGKRSETSRAAGERRGDGLGGVAGRDLGAFEPRRWIRVDGETGREVFDAYALPALAFGGGFRGCFGRKLAMMEFKIVVVLLILSFEFLPLPEEYESMAAVEKVFREPKFPFAKIRAFSRGTGAPKGICPEWRVTDAFDTIYSLLFQLLSRIVGATEVSEDVQLSRWMLSVFEKFENSNSTTGIIFPWLRVFMPSYLLRMALGIVLYLTFNRIITDRKRTGRRGDDALQYLLDQDIPLDVIIKFQISSVWAALLTTGANGTWLLTLLAHHPTWHSHCLTELHRTITTHRTSPAQSPTDVLDTLALDNWETEFPVLDACLREAIRVAMPGAVFRRNTSGKDVVIRDGDRKVGMRLAKLEITLIVAYFMARFDFELSDKQGNPSSEMPPLPHRNEHTAQKSKVPAYLRYKERSWS